MCDFIKNQVFVKTPVYTGDVSGVCAALYPYGGMVVMHDPSGCNSTYNTHDETRWDAKESLIFLSGLKESEAVLGKDERFLRDVIQTAGEQRPRFIALTNSPIPYLNGTDFEALSGIVEEKTGIPTFYVNANGMHDYTRGASAAFLALGKKFLPKAPEKKGLPGTEAAGVRLNVLGFTPLDFSRPDADRRLREGLEENGFFIESLWGADEDLAGVRRAAGAQVNLVLSGTGLTLAKFLEEAAHIPYVAGIPQGAFAPVVYEKLRAAAASGKSAPAYTALLREKPGKAAGLSGGSKAGDPSAMGGLHIPEEQALLSACRGRKTLVVGEAVAAASLAAGLRLFGVDAVPVVTTETVEGLLPPGTKTPKGEAAIEEALGGAGAVVADPLFAPLLPADCVLVRRPHFAYSGRLFQEQGEAYGHE